MAGKRWNGASWLDHTTKKRWNGSAWVDLTIAKRWNGSAWVDIYGGAGSLTFATADGAFTDSYSCDNPSGSCPLTYSVSDTDTYTVGGNVGAYTVSAVVATGPTVSIDTNTPGTMIVSTSVGRNITKEGEIKVTVTDTVGSADFYVPFAFSYTYTQDTLGPPFEPDVPPPEVQ